MRAHSQGTVTELLAQAAPPLYRGLMCGRFTLTDWDAIPIRFDVEPGLFERVRPRFNIAPSQTVFTIADGPDGPALRPMQWGFAPGWLKPTPGRPAPINARAETLLERPMFRGALTKTRCLIPANGFYEWQARPGERAKQPMYIHLKDGGLFAFAGLYTERRNDETGELLGSCAVVTTAPNELMEPIHNRMPVILSREDEDLWLDQRVTDAATALSCLRPYPPELMEAFPVSPLVSSVRNDGPGLIEPLTDYEKSGEIVHS